MTESKIWIKKKRAYGNVLALILLAVMAVLFNMPYLSSGYFLDDLLLYKAIMAEDERYVTLDGRWADLDLDALNEFWWLDDEFDVAFLRPLPSLFVEGFIRTFEKNAAPIHLLAIILPLYAWRYINW